MDDLVTWLRQQLDDDERVALAVAGYRQRRGEFRWTQCDPEREPGLIGDGCGNVVTYDEGSPNPEQAAHIARHDPARVLAEVDAKRRILDLHPYAGLRSAPESCGSCVSHPGPCDTLRLLASPYADRPGYRDEWKPEA